MSAPAALALSYPPAMRRTARISGDGLYRWSLTREWFAPDEPPRWVCFCGLNPSVADADIDDPTIRREINFAQRLGANALVKVNKYAFRATDPRVLVAYAREHGMFAAIGPHNLDALREAVALGRGELGLGVFAAWGALPRGLAQSQLVLGALGSPLKCLGTTKDGSPRHPLYLPKTATPMEWRP